MKSKVWPWQYFMSFNEKLFAQGGTLYLILIVIPLGDLRDPNLIPSNIVPRCYIHLRLNTINTIKYHWAPSNTIEYHHDSYTIGCPRIPLNTIEYHPIRSTTVQTIQYHLNQVFIQGCYIHLRWHFSHKRSSLLGLWGRGKGVKKGRYFARPLSPAFVLM